MSRHSGSCGFKINRDQIMIVVAVVLIVGVVSQFVVPSADAAPGIERQSQLATFPPAIFGPSIAPPEPLRLPDAAIEPIEWNALKGWPADDRAAAFATS